MSGPSVPRGEAVADIDTLQAALFYLISRYSFRPSPILAGRVIDQLDALCRHPSIALLPAQHRVYATLLNLWRSRAPAGEDRRAARTTDQSSFRPPV